VFLTPDYTADIFGAFTQLPRKLDLAWHFRGNLSSDLQLQPMKFPAPVERGYSELVNTRSTSTAKPYTMNFEVPGGRARFLAAGGQDTEVILGDGWLRLERPTTILQRRTSTDTLFGNLIELDYDKTEFVKNLTLDGSLKQGFGLLSIETVNGSDYCYASYRPGTQTAGPLKTDALQAYVRTVGKAPTAIFLGGGKILEANGAMVARDQTGLVLVEQADNGAFLIANPSPSAGKVTVKLAALEGLEAFALASDGSRSGEPVKMQKSPAGLTFEMGPNTRIEMAKAGAPSLSDYRQAILKKVQEEQEAKIREAFEACVARTTEREKEAATLPIPANTRIVVQAEAFTGQSGGEVKVADNKKASVFTSLSGWNDAGHWLEYTVDAPADGYYNLSLVYCTQLANAERVLEINGEVQEPFAQMIFPVTGGWSNNSDDWKLFTLMNPTNNKPLLVKLKKGANTLRMTNSSGHGINLDYLMVTSPDVTPERLGAQTPK
jgi:hypothetical protein